jgi:hypothetical protein
MEYQKDEKGNFICRCIREGFKRGNHALSPKLSDATLKAAGWEKIPVVENPQTNISATDDGVKLHRITPLANILTDGTFEKNAAEITDIEFPNVEVNNLPAKKGGRPKGSTNKPKKKVKTKSNKKLVTA